VHNAVQQETEVGPSTSGISVPIDFQHDGDKIPSADFARGVQGGGGERSVPRPEMGYVYFQNIKAYFLNGVPQAPELSIQHVDMSTVEPAEDSSRILLFPIQKRFVSVTFIPVITNILVTMATRCMNLLCKSCLLYQRIVSIP
jgi:hypothetical protein